MSAPVFVVGASRSGTNLVRALLNAGSTLWVSGETHFFDDLRPHLPQEGTTRLAGDDRDRCERYFLALSHRAFGQEGDPAESTLAATELRALAEELGGTGDAYFEAFCRIRASGRGRERWGEKTPRHVYRLDELLGAFPEAKVICLVRDPRAVVASYRDWHGAAERRGVVEREELAVDRRRTQRSFNVVLMSLLWRGVVRTSHEALRRHGPDRVRLQPFEHLTAEPEAEARELCAWLGLDFERAMLEIPVVNSSYATETTGVSTEPVERWRGQLSEREIATVQSCCGPLMDELGYPLDPVSVSKPRLALAWTAAPFAAGRAAFVNRRRLGRATEYLRRRGGAALSRRSL